MRTPPHLMPALITPFDKKGALDRAAHQHNTKVLDDLGIRGFVVAGSTGEGPLLEPGERGALVKDIRDGLGRRPFVMVGVWGESVRQAESQIAEAADAGANAVLVVTPTTLARRSVSVQRDYFQVVAKLSPIPVLLYSVPPNTGYALDLDTTIELSHHDNIVGMKDSGGDAVRIERIIDGAPADFLMFNGASRSITLAVIAGAHGGITASANFIPERISELVAVARKSPKKALELQPSITALCASVEGHGIPGIKAGAQSIGLEAGYPRTPFKPVAKRIAETIHGLLQ